MSRDQVPGHGRDGHATGGEHDVVRIVRPAVGDLLVERLPALVELPEPRFVLRERPVAAAHALPRSLDVDLDQHGCRPLTQRFADRLCLNGAAAEGDHARRHRQRPERGPLLELAEGASLEQLRNRPLPRLDLCVHIEKRTVQQRRNLPAERRLAGAHEADQRDMPPYRGCQSIRSRYALCAATKSPIASPPNFSRAARASSNATAASATTASASTAATSLRSTSASPVSPVARSTERSGRISVGRGFMAARTTISSPFETPPSIPPARLVSRCRPAPLRRISSCAAEPRRPASANPSPISTPLTA